jgi:hypothetical protein
MEIVSSKTVQPRLATVELHVVLKINLAMAECRRVCTPPRAKKSMTFSEFPRLFSLKFHDIFVNCLK